MVCCSLKKKNWKQNTQNSESEVENGNKDTLFSKYSSCAGTWPETNLMIKLLTCKTVNLFVSVQFVLIVIICCLFTVNMVLSWNVVHSFAISSNSGKIQKDGRKESCKPILKVEYKTSRNRCVLLSKYSDPNCQISLCLKFPY